MSSKRSRNQHKSAPKPKSMWKITLTLAIIAIVVILIVRYAMKDRTAQASGTQGSAAIVTETLA
ncbi:MAG: hypothetical protein A2898_05545 [Candidatus Kerfeldbacteria bacterium RIFCSPLOWO2_01_FULL_48_11]|uniref:Uncharacterized protein n=1 Tax=Candidatus Kerfeldbacteria bacterium RIFCSPLOWO2_01_FULL_48_11 TaxID=1798543 RepID=A0A1G2AZY2_9BACT|nr:MAG: hypothetical protein UY34_C0017G0015 [Parcubacteria group bacterium GW2011_GWA2_48_9]KKW16742.1 MAG: hypothetical protein UY52_C0001G0062 [Parcubacteria group bacterium GW2011_GWC2_49_9]OGY82468.1 MAG: hypothetical protein A2898_05545 [Candidatus Kerfeldbacteria bacterium RIFCSPLOWO2_01_FULL_48_11]HCJ52277.1 hypothetical protein [Candidatus Kerfeldbacteria bacterium]HCM68688.1 hypothetical protein [Candidatus Kerfeldbacteria bacterium]